MDINKKRPSYSQPHNIHVVSDLNSALREKEKYSEHSRQKHNTKKSLKKEIIKKYGDKITKNQIKIIQRREEALYLASRDLLYCSSHERFICVKDVLERNCYIRHRGENPFCKYLMMKNQKDNFVPFRVRGLATKLFFS